MSVTGATTGVLREAVTPMSARRRTTGRVLRDRVPTCRPLLVFERRHRLLGDCVARALTTSGLSVDRLDTPCDDVELPTVRDHALIVVDCTALLDDAVSGLVDEIHECDACVLLVASDPTHAEECGQLGADEIVAATDDLATLVNAVHRLLPDVETDWTPVGGHGMHAESDDPRELLALLSPREQVVLGSMMCGLSAAEIAEEHFVAVTTVRSQIRSILTKLNVRSQLAAVALAHEADWRTDGRQFRQFRQF